MARRVLKLVERNITSPKTPTIFDKGATIPIPRELSEKIAKGEAIIGRLHRIIAGGGYMMAWKEAEAEALIEELKAL